MLPADVDNLIAREENRQFEIWGIQNHPNGTGLYDWQKVQADLARESCDHAARTGDITWAHILDEEVKEAFAESDPVKLKTELVQVAAVVKSWIKDIDRKEKYAVHD